MYSRADVAEWMATFVFKEKPPFLKEALEKRRKPRKFTVHLGDPHTINPVVMRYNPLLSLEGFIRTALNAFNIRDYATGIGAQLLDIYGNPIKKEYNNLDEFDKVVLKLHSNV